MKSGGKEVKGRKKKRKEQGLCLCTPISLEICIHFTELRKEVTGRNKAVVEKQLYIAEVGLFGKCLLNVWMCKGIYCVSVSVGEFVSVHVIT